MLQTVLIYLGSFVAVLSVVVVVHELGHFWAARACRIPVKSFSLGFGPQLIALRDKHNTVWKISAIPLGGFVSWIDDTDPTSTLPATEEQRDIDPAEARRRGYFRAQPIWARSFVTAAGPAANFVFSIFAFALLAFTLGDNVTDYSRIPARILSVEPNSAASAAGLRPNDIITSIDGQSVANFTELQLAVSHAPAGHALALNVQRGEDVLSLSATPTRRPGVATGILGVHGPNVLPSEQRIIRYGPLGAVAHGAGTTWNIVAMTVDYIGKVFTGRASGDQIAGPLGILSKTGEVASSALASQPPPGIPGGSIGVLVISLFSLSALLSVAVGFVNILPIPVLDGGHLLLYGVEALRGGKPLPPKAQELAFWTGVSVIVSLFLFATWNDITRSLPGMH